MTKLVELVRKTAYKTATFHVFTTIHAIQLNIMNKISSQLVKLNQESASFSSPHLALCHSIPRIYLYIF